MAESIHARAGAYTFKIPSNELTNLLQNVLQIDFVEAKNASLKYSILLEVFNAIE